MFLIDLAHQAGCGLGLFWRVRRLRFDMSCSRFRVRDVRGQLEYRGKGNDSGFFHCGYGAAIAWIGFFILVMIIVAVHPAFHALAQQK